MVHIFIALEMNQVSWSDREASGAVKNEIIQIGAVKLDESYRVIDTYEAFVKPTYSKICPICTRLTGITQEQADSGKSYPEAIVDFAEWAGTDACFYSWSDNDSRQLRHEAVCKKVDPAVIAVFDRWVDFQLEYCNLVEQSRMGLDVALKGAGLFQIGAKHSAAADALSSVQLFKLVHSPVYFSEENRARIILYTRIVRRRMQEKKQANKARRTPKYPREQHRQRQSRNHRTDI